MVMALDPSYFGFTDPLTNTWRPKKFSGSFLLQIQMMELLGVIMVSGTQYSGSYPKTEAFNGSDSQEMILVQEFNLFLLLHSLSTGKPITLKNLLLLSIPVLQQMPSYSNGSVALLYPLIKVELVVSITTHLVLKWNWIYFFVWSRNYHGSEDTGIVAIEVDGVLLMDSGLYWCQ